MMRSFDDWEPWRPQHTGRTLLLGFAFLLINAAMFVGAIFIIAFAVKWVIG